MTNIVLTGLPGSGKTTFGKLLAKRLSYSFIDLDDYVALPDKSVRELYRQEGEALFRKREYEALLKLGSTQNSIIALGGGTLTHPSSLKEALKLGTLVYLRESPETLFKKIKILPPYLNPEDPLSSFQKLAKEREPEYLKAVIILDINDRPFEELLDYGIKQLRHNF